MSHFRGDLTTWSVIEFASTGRVTTLGYKVQGTKVSARLSSRWSGAGRRFQDRRWTVRGGRSLPVMPQCGGGGAGGFGLGNGAL